MSQEAVKKFQEAINKYVEIKQKIKQMRNKHSEGQMSPSETYDFITKEIIPFAKEQGYEFTFDDYINYQLKEESNSLTDEELFLANGGKFFKNLGFASTASLLLLNKRSDYKQ